MGSPHKSILNIIVFKAEQNIMKYLFLVGLAAAQVDHAGFYDVPATCPEATSAEICKEVESPPYGCWYHWKYGCQAIDDECDGLENTPCEWNPNCYYDEWESICLFTTNVCQGHNWDTCDSTAGCVWWGSVTECKPE